MKIETWLPVFPGFYGTIFEPDEESEIEYINDLRNEIGLPVLPFEAIKFDYSDYEDEISKQCCAIMERELSGFVTSIQFQSLSSPKEYNFYNDSINIVVELSEENEKTIMKFIIDNISDFQRYIKNRYTSYDGFLSRYSNDPGEWLTDPDLLSDKHKLGSVLEFICGVREINQETLYYDCEERVSATNYDECTSLPYCAVCKEFFTGPNKNVCPDCIEQGKVNTDLIYCCKCNEEINNEHEKKHFARLIKLHELEYSEVVCNDCSL
jgi:hypothetical protein